MASAPPLPVTPDQVSDEAAASRKLSRAPRLLATPAPDGGRERHRNRRPGVGAAAAGPKSGTRPSLSADPTRANFLHWLALGKQIFVLGLWGEVAERVHPASLCAAASPGPGPRLWRATVAMLTGDHRMAPAVFRGIPSAHEDSSASVPELPLWSVLPVAGSSR